MLDFFLEAGLFIGSKLKKIYRSTSCSIPHIKAFEQPISKKPFVRIILLACQSGFLMKFISMNSFCKRFDHLVGAKFEPMANI